MAGFLPSFRAFRRVSSGVSSSFEVQTQNNFDLRLRFRITPVIIFDYCANLFPMI